MSGGSDGFFSFFLTLRVKEWVAVFAVETRWTIFSNDFVSFFICYHLKVVFHYTLLFVFTQSLAGHPEKKTSVKPQTPATV